ncbi:putative reverse transcriptase domain-containing protein [Tanacetum coccineum]
MTFTDGTKEITFKTPYKDPEKSELSNEGHDLLSSRVILSKDDYDRGCRKPSDLEDGFIETIINLEPTYATGIDDEGEVTIMPPRRFKKSFVSFAFTHFIDIAPAALNTSYEIELADGKGKCGADALRKKKCSTKAVRAMSITIHSGIKTKILEAQGEASKDLKAPAEWLRGLEIHFERTRYGDLYFYDSYMIPSFGLTKSAHFLPIREDYKTEKLARIYINEIVARYGVPASIISDRDGRFASHLWQALQKALGTKLHMSTAYHPETDGQSERTIQTLEDMLRACVRDFGGNWDTRLLLVEFSYNNSYHTSIKRAPFEALYGRKCRFPVIWTEVGESQLIGPEIV